MKSKPVSNGGREYEKVTKKLHIGEVRKKCYDIKQCLENTVPSSLAVCTIEIVGLECGLCHVT